MPLQKESWQMTREEWLISGTPGRISGEPRPSGYDRIIKEAYLNGYQVPLPILKEVSHVYQLALENSPEFLKAFGQSKALTGAWEHEGKYFQDGNIVTPERVIRRPAIVYHGGNTPIKSWEMAGKTKPVFFTDDERIAEYWAKSFNKKPHVTTAYLVMNNPVEFQTPPYANVDQSYMNSRYDEFTHGKYQGYDGMIFRQLTEAGYDSDVYVVRSPTQIIPIQSTVRKGEKNIITELFPFSIKRKETISEGKPVPPKVLKDYPDLQPIVNKPLTVQQKKERELDKTKSPEYKGSIKEANLIIDNITNIEADNSNKLWQSQSDRTSLSQSSDTRQSNRITISRKDPKVKIWVRDPGRMDVLGIDTPSFVTKVSMPKPRTFKNPRPKTQRPRRKSKHPIKGLIQHKR